MPRKKINIKQLNAVHAEARITTRSPILLLLNDIDSKDYFYGRMIEAIRIAQDTDRVAADNHLRLVSQLCTIVRSKLREEAWVAPQEKTHGASDIHEQIAET